MGSERKFKVDANRSISWMGHPYIASVFNSRFYNYDSEVWGSGLFEVLKRKYVRENGKFNRAISIACGNGRKELEMVREGFIDHLKLYELSKIRISEGENFAKRFGIEDKVEFIYGDAFELETEIEQFDLVLWLNAIHHMENTRKAVEWSSDVLMPGGFFIMDDYVGPNRFQWPRVVMEYCNKARAKFPDSIFKRSEQFNKRRQQVLRVVDQSLVSEIDASVAADSSRLLETISFTFPRREEFLYSSGVSTLVLNDISSRILDEKYFPLIDNAINLDLELVQKGHVGFAAVIAIK